MAKENVEKLLEELNKHPEAEEYIKEYGKIETLSDYAGALLSAAKRLGIETQTDDAELAGYLKSMEASERKSTEQAAGDMMELEDDDLENVAGGVKCDGTNARIATRENTGGGMEALGHAFECWTNDKCATYFWN